MKAVFSEPLLLFSHPSGLLTGSKNPFAYQISMNKAVLTLLALSTSPHGSLLLKCIPVKGVPVGGSKIDASIVRYSTFSGLC